METSKRNRQKIKKDGQKIYKLSFYYRTLQEIAYILELSEKQAKKSLEEEEIYNDVMENLEKNRIIGNNFYFAYGEFHHGKFYLQTGDVSKQKGIFILKSDNILHSASSELIEVQPGDFIFEVWKEKQNFVINKSQITNERNQAKNITHKIWKKGDASDLTGLEQAMISWI